MSGANTEQGALGTFTPRPQNVEKFTAEKGKKYRIGFPLGTDNGQVRVDKVFYWNKFEQHEGGLKIKALLTDDVDFNAKVTKVLGEPVYRYVTIVAQYSTEATGALVKPLSYKLVPFVFSDSVYADLISINDEFPINKHDLVLNIKDGTDPKFQNLTILPTSKEAIWLNVKLVEKMRTDSNASADDMVEAVASKWGKDKLIEKLGLTPSTASTSTADDTTDEDVVVIDDIDIDEIV